MTTRSTESRQLDRARGCLLGLAVGDALGGPLEFLSPEEIQTRYSGEPVREYVGGGWLSRQELEAGEKVMWSFMACRAQGRGRSICGRLFATDRRVDAT